MDDDIYVDFNQLGTILEGQYPSLKASILGYKHVGLIPQRRREDKWFVSHMDFPEYVYPDFVSGWAYITSQDVAHRIVHKANEGHHDIRAGVTWIDDLWITGVIAGQLNISLLTLNSFYTPDVSYLRCCQMKEDHAEKFCDFIVGPSEGDVALMASLGQMSRTCQKNGCTKRQWNDTCFHKKKTWKSNEAHYFAQVIEVST